MEYMSCPEAAKKWGISERRVQILCRENRIPGVSILGFMWLIPKDAEKPIDGRTKQGKELHHLLDHCRDNSLLILSSLVISSRYILAFS